MKAKHDHIQTAQRLKVGLIGLAAVVLLIGLASAIFGSASQMPPANVLGETNTASSVAANELSQGEPLAELGAAPGSANDQAVAAAR